MIVADFHRTRDRTRVIRASRGVKQTANLRALGLSYHQSISQRSVGIDGTVHARPRYNDNQEREQHEKQSVW